MNPAPPGSITVDNPAGGPVPVRLRFSGKARRLKLEYDRVTGDIAVVVPKGASLARARKFVMAQRAWILERADRPLSANDCALAPGTRLPVLDQTVLIEQSGASLARAMLVQRPDEATGVLLVSGTRPEMARQVEIWLRSRAAEEIRRRVSHFCSLIGAYPGKIALRDTTSQWGSCSSRQNLSFSWRLIMAPSRVLDYICAHEVAHLIEKNHQVMFWDLVESLVGDCRAERKWLREKGAKLHRYR